MAAYSIRAAAKESGLSAHTIRAWEKRHQALTPGRTATNRRAYGEEDVARLKLLRAAVKAGHSIGLIAGLPSDELRRLAGEETPGLQPSGGFFETSMAAMDQMDAAGLKEALSAASTVLGIDLLLSQVIIPLVGELDRGWTEGRYSIAQEHLASAAIRSELEKVRMTLPAKPGAARLLVTTPAGELHELGAIMVAISAARMGLSVTYLGPNLPAQEIAAAARQTRAHAIALSLVYPEDSQRLERELSQLRREVGERLPILVGGRGVTVHQDLLKRIDAQTVGALDDLQLALSRI